MEGKVAIVMGSDSDLPYLKQGLELLSSFNVPYEVRVLSAHRTPDEVMEFARKAKRRGIKVIIAVAGGAAHLAGVIAGHTTLPVIGVPVYTKTFKGFDSFISMLQMPRGIPVAVMSIGESGAVNAVLLALQILGLSDKKLQSLIKNYRENLRKKTLNKDKKISDMFGS